MEMPPEQVSETIEDRIERVLGRRPVARSELSGGCIGRVLSLTLHGGQRVVAKVGTPGDRLDIEGAMLRDLAARSSLPVPRVLHDEPTLLVMTQIEGDGVLGPTGQEHAADLLAALHEIGSPEYGLAYDTLIGGLDQPNGPMASWAAFYGERRLRFMAHCAARADRLASATVARIERIADRADELVGDASPPGLIHGDVWSGNVLAHAGRIAAFIDPAIYFADPEIELAFITLFSTFGRAFFDRYAQRRPIRDGFFEVRRDLYVLYPLLVHARLFGGGYEASVCAALDRLGF